FMFDQQSRGSYNISSVIGISLVQGDTCSQLAAVTSSADPARTTLATVDPATGQKTQFSEKLITTGSLGGLLAFRSDLDGARNQVGQLAMALGSSFNAQHMQGKDSDGDAGGAFFSLGTPSVLANTNNTGGASLTATWSDTTRVQASDYSVSYDGTNWTATRLSDNTKSTVTVDATAKTLSFDGLSVAYDQLPASKDSFTIKPVSSVVSGMSVLVTEESKLAAASSTGGASNNENVQKLLGLQTANVINGKSTLTQGYASLVAQVGNKASTLETTSKTQTAVVTQLTNQQQSVSGVNLDEEYSNLTRYQQYYMANAQVLQTASTIFQSLIGAVS
ncbi:MAG TPA: flagellar hook-associated protein FlgK, partial [Erwinia persicina]|nr:flagellar hook-associated protein FlgK [Erwinia persicina]